MDRNFLGAAVLDGVIFKHLKPLWEECGFTAEDVAKRGDEATREIEEHIQKIICREQQMKQQMLQRLNTLLNDASKLSKELDVHFDPTLYETVPLCEAVTKIECETRRLQQKKSALVEQISEISEKEAELCSCLGELPRIKVECTLPSKEEIASFNERLRTLQLKKATLLRVFKDKKSRITTFMRELESEPSEDFIKKVCGDDAKFKLSEENMRKLDELETCFQEKILERKKLVNDLWGTLTNFWVRLKESATYQGDFLSTYEGIGISTVTALKQEIRRCETRRRENIPLYLKAVKEEIEELWDKCCFGKSQRLSLLEFYAEGSNEALLERLEEEVSTLQKFYSENRCLLDLATQYSELWEKSRSLEEKSHMKDRLFHNRGGELLKEEKERKCIQKELPKIENKLKKLLGKYEERYNKPFYFNDENLNEKMEALWLRKDATQQTYKSSWQKKQSSSSKDSHTMKRKLEFEPKSSSKMEQQLACLPKPYESNPHRDYHDNVTRRRLLSPLRNINETFISGIKKIDDEKCSGLKIATEHTSNVIKKREAFRDINNTKPQIALKVSKIPMKPPRKNIGVAVHLRQKSSEFIGCQQRKKIRRSSLPDIDRL